MAKTILSQLRTPVALPNGTIAILFLLIDSILGE